MPIIPGPDQIQRTVIQPGNRVAQYQGGVAEDAAARAAQAEGQASAGVFRAVGGLASQVTDLADKELDRIEGLKVAEAVTKNRQQTLSLIEGYKNTRGGDVTAKDYLKTHMAAYEKQSLQVASVLTTDRQREAFKQAAESDRIGYSSGLMSHAFAETDKYTKIVRDASISTDRASAAAQYLDPKAVSASVSSTATTVAAVLDYEGITDPKARAMAMLEHTGAIHATVVGAALENQDPKYAMGYLEDNKAAMTPEQVRSVSARVKPAIEYAEAVDLADTADRMKTAGKPSSEIQKYLTHAAKTPGALSLAKSVVQANAQATKEEEDSKMDGFITKFYDQGASLSTALALRRSPAFNGLTKENQDKLYEHLEQQGQQADARGRVNADAKWDSTDVRIAFLDAISDPNLVSKTKDQIRRLEMTLGPRYTKQVLDEYTGQKSGVAKFNITKEILNEGIPLDLREKRGSPSGEAKRQEHIAAFKGLVESGLQTFKETQKRAPSDAEQAAIVLAARRDISTPRTLFGFGVGTTETPVYELPKAQRDALTATERKVAQAAAAVSGMRGMTEAEWKATMVARAAKAGTPVSPAHVNAMWNNFNKGK